LDGIVHGVVVQIAVPIGPSGARGSPNARASLSRSALSVSGKKTSIAMAWPSAYSTSAAAS